jgi:hypothetical protein
MYATRAAFLSDGDDGTTGGGDVPIEGEGAVEFQRHEKVVIDQNHLVLLVRPYLLLRYFHPGEMWGYVGIWCSPNTLTSPQILFPKNTLP